MNTIATTETTESQFVIKFTGENKLDDEFIIYKAKYGDDFTHFNTPESARCFTDVGLAKFVAREVMRRQPHPHITLTGYSIEPVAA